MKPRALITGASRGIGAAIAVALAQKGHPVILNYRSNHQAAQELQKKIVAQGGVVELAPFDVANAEEVARAMEVLLKDKDDPIGVLVNNAGLAKDASFPIMNSESWEVVTRTTLDGFFHVTKPLVMPMVRRRWGRIINISSVSGVTGNRGQVNYSAAKAGLIGATKSLARELAKRGVTVNCVAPGMIETDMTRDLPVEEVLKDIPMRRFGKPEEVASLVAYLASEESGYITGQVIGINGGLA